MDNLFVYYHNSEGIKAFRKGMELAAQFYGPPPEDAEPMLPDITGPEQFKSLIALLAVHIIKAGIEGQSKVVYHFASWDIEHGLDITMLRDQVLHIG